MKSSRRSAIDPFIVMDVMEAARKAEAGGRHVIHMEVGQPGTPAPAGARAHLAAAMEHGQLGYTVTLGIPELRARIARLYGEWYGVDLDPGRVVVTSGASGAFILAFTALFDAGQRVGLAEPGYPSYRQILRAMDLQPVGIPTDAASRFQPGPGDLSPDLDGLIVAAPGNPAGTMLDRDEIAGLIDTARERGISYISDEIYHGIQYERPAISALEFSDDLYVVNSFSKYFSMTGWRVGWLVAPEDHVRVIERIAQNMFICAPHASQVTALAAMDCHEELQGNLEVYRANRQILIDGLRAAGITEFAPPDGAFYVYADVSHLTDDALALSADMLEKAGIAVTPGLDFDPVRGGHYLRFSYARATADIVEGMERLAAYVRGRGA